MHCPFVPSASSGEIEKLEAEIRALRAELVICQDDFSNLQNSYRRLEEKFADQQELLDEARMSISQLTLENSQLKNTVQRQRVKLRAWRSFADVLRGPYSKLLSMLSISKQGISKLGLTDVYSNEKVLVCTAQQRYLGPLPKDYAAQSWLDTKNGEEVHRWLPFTPSGSRVPVVVEYLHTHYPAWLYKDEDPDPPDPVTFRSGISQNCYTGKQPIKWSETAASGFAHFGDRISAFMNALLEVMRLDFPVIPE